MQKSGLWFSVPIKLTTYVFLPLLIHLFLWNSYCYKTRSHHPSIFPLMIVSAAPIGPYRLRDGDAKM